MCSAMKSVCVCVIALAAGFVVASTAQADFAMAGTLYVDLDAVSVAKKVADGGTPTTWSNAGTLGNFTNNGMTFTKDVGGTGWIGVTGQGSGSASPVSGPQTMMYGPNAVADIAGNSNRSIEIWAYNPDVPSYFPSYEIMLAYSSHSSMADVWFNQGDHGAGSTDPGAGAIVHYGNDRGWMGGHPTLGQWNYLVYTYNGAGVDKLYVNGELNSSYTCGTLATSESAIFVNATETLGFNGSMSYRAIRVHGGELSLGDIQSNWAYGQVAYAVTPEPSTLTLAALSLVGMLVYAWRKRK